VDCWADLPIADGFGYLRIKDLAHVRRIASHLLGFTRQARIKVTGVRIQVWVNGHVACHLDA